MHLSSLCRVTSSSLVFGLSVGMMLACGGVGDPSSVSAPGLSVGDAVRVTGTNGARPGMVATLYGKLVQVRYVDGSASWVQVAEVEPPGVPAELDASDTCVHTAGAKVLAPAGSETEPVAGTVGEVHGKMLSLSDGRWMDCEEVTAAPAEVAPKPSPSPASNGRAAAISKCKSGCNSSCRGAQNKAKCVGSCRRACAK